MNIHIGRLVKTNGQFYIRTLSKQIVPIDAFLENFKDKKIKIEVEVLE